MEILQVVGYSNSGKTTTAAALIQYLSQAGVSVASFKHHGHGGRPDGFETKDSMIHQEAGAVISGAEGAGLLQFTQKQKWDLQQIIQIYELCKVDVLIIEGYKKKDYRKIVLLHKKEDLHLLKETSNIIAVVSDLQLNLSKQKYPFFKRSELAVLCRWVEQNITTL